MQPEYQVETWCKNCLFAEYTDNTQTGCKLGRHKIFNPEENTKEENTEWESINQDIINIFDKL